MKTTRRQFLKQSTLGLAGPMILSSSVLGRAGATSPNNRIQVGTIGVGGKGLDNQRNLRRDNRVAITSVCDVDANHRRSALEDAKLPDSSAHSDFRELLERNDVDAVMIATPDHWHSIIAAAAARAGKDLYCEKPLTSSIREGRIVSDIVRKEKRVLQCGTWRRSGPQTRQACEWVRNGYIGTLKHVEVGVPGKFAIRGGFTGLEGTQPVPKELDYNMWQGPAPSADYTEARVHFNFRWVNDYAPGYITDWGAHFIDVVQWGNNMDDSGPIEVEVREQTRRDKGIYNAPEGFHIDYQYANGVTMTMKAETDKSKWGIKFIGTEGWVFSENKTLDAHPKSILEAKLKESETHLYVSNDHYRNFIDCVYSRNITAAPVETAHRTASACYMGSIAAEVGGSLRFDPKSERFVNNDAANQHLMKVMRAPWKLV
jgi:predicted dehydrogenase